MTQAVKDKLDRIILYLTEQRYMLPYWEQAYWEALQAAILTVEGIRYEKDRKQAVV